MSDLNRIKFSIFMTLGLACVMSDSYFNGSRPASIYTDIAFGLWMLAICIAFAPPLLDFFSEGDKLVRGVALLVACVGFAMSILSGYGTIEQKNVSIASDNMKAQSIQHRLDTDYSYEAMRRCESQPASMCKVSEQRAKKEALQSELDALSHSQASAELDWGRYLLSWALLIGVAVLPLVSLCCARILSTCVNWEPKREPETVPNLGTGNQKSKKWWPRVV